MRRFLTAPAGLVVCAGLLAQTPLPRVQSQATAYNQVACIVSGRVVTASEGLPLKSARVVLMPENVESVRQVVTTTTDSDGRFILKDVAAGRYQFLASHPGFVTGHYQQIGDDTEALLSLTAGEQVGNVLFRLTVSGVITGRVTNEDGEGVANVELVALRPQSDDEEEESPSTAGKRELRPASRARTDDRGQYRIYGLKPGDYYVKATEALEPERSNFIDQDFWLHQIAGNEYAPVYFPGVNQRSQAQVIPVKAGDEEQADIVMPRVRTVEIAGHVFSRSGPVKNVMISLNDAEDGSVNDERTSSTDENGAFKMKGVPPGSYMLSALMSEDSFLYELRAHQKVEVGGENIESIVISMDGGSNLQGQVTVAGPGSPALDRMGVNLVGVDDDVLGSQGRVKKDGTFEVKMVSNGSYGISMWGLEKNWYIKSVRFNGEEVLDKGLQIEKSSTGKLDVMISLASMQLEGTVSGPDGAVAGARVSVSPEPATPYNRMRSQRSSTDQSGHFSFSGMAPGAYRVRAKYRSGTGELRSEPQDISLSEWDHKTLQLTVLKPPAN